MATASSQNTGSSVRSGVHEAHVVNWPFKDEWAFALPTILATMLCGWFAGDALESRPAGVLCFLFLQLPLWRLWLPVTYDIGSRGIVQSVAGRARLITWNRIARVRIRTQGLLITIDQSELPLALFGSLYIRWQGRRDEILAVVRQYVPGRVSETNATSAPPGE